MTLPRPFTTCHLLRHPPLIMKAEIYKQYPELEFADDTDATLYALIEAAKQAWHAIDDLILYSL